MTINVVVPMAGAGKRFSDAGYTDPKPFISVKGKYLLRQSIDSCSIPGRHIFCAQQSHITDYSSKFEEVMSPDDKLVPIQGLTEGAACTILLAREYINNDDPLFIVNSDQYVDWDYGTFMARVTHRRLDGGIITLEGSSDKWSYARTGENSDIVEEVAEKKVISTHATVGIYYWTRGSDFVKYAERMINKNIRTNNEYYVCPVYNEAIQDGKQVIIFPCTRWLSLGTPEELKESEPLL